MKNDHESPCVLLSLSYLKPKEKTFILIYCREWNILSSAPPITAIRVPLEGV